MNRTRFSAPSRIVVALAALLGLGILLAGSWGWPGQSAGKQVALQGQAAREHLQQQGQYASLAEAMKLARYSVREAAGQRGEFYANNPAQQFQAAFSPVGVEVRAANTEGTGWQVGLKLRSVGYGARQLAVGAGRLSATGDRIEYERSLQSTIHNPQSAIKEWYLNRADGLEQGFTLAQPPGERRAGERLRVLMALAGDLRAQGAGQAIELARESGERVLRYEHLVVTDAQGQKLTAAMGANAAQLWLEVDDAEAVYPVTIDPTLVQQAYLKASNTDAGDTFGSSVAVADDTVVAGAPSEQSSATGVNGNQANNSISDAGAAYVFTRSGATWSQQAYLKASNTGGGDKFGNSVAISGNTIVVGAPFEDSSATGVNGSQTSNAATDSGAAYVFVRSGTTWTQQAYLKASNTETQDLFGQSVAVSGDLIVVGAHGEDSNATGVNGNQTNNLANQAGAAYVFVRSGASWSQQAYLKAPNTAAIDQFGFSVAASGETVVVGVRNEDSGAANSGAACVFVRSGTTWSQQALLKASNPDASDQFGSSVAVAGETIVIGAISEDSNAAGVNGDGSNNLSSGSGAAYVFVRSGATWSQQAYLKASNTGASDQFGSSVAVAGDTVVIGAPNEGSNATGINGDQNNDDASNAGAAYVFVRSGTTWSPQAYLKASNMEAGDGFSKVAAAGDTLVIGASSEDSNAVGINGNQNNNTADSSGAVYVFVSQPQTITLSPTSLPNGARGVAYSQQISASGGTAPYSFSLTGTLPNGLTLSSGGLLSGTSLQSGSFGFTINATDSTTDVGSQVYGLVIANHPPVAMNDAANTNEDNAVTISVLANDTDQDNDTLTITGTTTPANGAVIVNGNGTITYTPNANFFGTNTFNYTINDGNGGTATATVTANVAAVPDNPDAVNDFANTTPGTPITVQVLANDTDVDGDTLTVSSVTQPANGMATLNANGSVSYTPNANFLGIDSFGYTISDGQGGSDSATVNVNVALRDSKGTDFWLAFPTNHNTTPTLSLFITGTTSTTGAVSVPGISFSTNFSVTPGAVTTVSVPATTQLSGSDATENKGIHVTAQADVTVYGLNRIQFTTDAYQGLPTDILGTSYVVLGYKNVNVFNGSQFAIVGTVNGTTVTITPSVTTGVRTGGVPYTITLNQGQTYQLVNTASTGDLSGTIISSSQPVAVFGSHQCANIPNSTTLFCDYVVEQIPPTDTWGKNFITVPLATRLNGDTFRFLASTNGTTVSVNGSAVATLNRGQVHERIITSSAQITANQPILVAQYSNGTTYDGVTSDPFMMLIPPYEQFLASYTVTTPASGFAINYINVVAPNATVGQITLDGSVIPVGSFTAIGSSGFSGAKVSVSLGTHNLSGTLPFGAFMYGFDVDDSYGYPGGLSLAPVALVTSLALTPETATGAVGAQHCLTATVRDQSNNPLSGIRVDFNVTGVNSSASFANTNGSGQAQYCYTPANCGMDTIAASVGSLADTASLTVNAPLSIVTQPVSQTLCVGAPASFSVTASGSGPFTYQWRKNGNNINGATNSSFNIKAVATGDAGAYDAVVTGACGATVTSATATLTVNTAPSVTTQPTDQTACPGANAVFMAAASGAPAPTVQWQVSTDGGANFSNLAGATNPTLTLNGVMAGMNNNRYRAVFSNSCNTTTTTAASLTVNTSTGIATQPATQTICSGAPASFAVTASGTGPFTYQWRKDGTDISGATASSYNIAAAVAGDAGAYTVIVTGACGSVISNVASLTINAVTSIATPPTDQTVCLGAPAAFSVVAGGTGPFTYQWRKNKTPIGGATASAYGIAATVAGDAGAYDVVVTGACGPAVTSVSANLTVNAPTSVAAQPISQTVCLGAPVSFSGTAGGTGPFTYQWRKGGAPISGATASTYNIAAAAAGDAGSYDVVVTGACGSATSNAATLTVNAATAIAAQPTHQASCLGGSATFSVTATGVGLGYQWRKNGAPISGATSGSFTLASIAAGDAASYDVVVTGACGAVVSSAATLTINSSTNINTQPANQTACVGGAASFSVAASGAGTLTYQWRKGGVNIGGAHAASFTINPVAAADAGSYDVVVTSDCGTTTSNAATLTINAATAINTQPQGATVCAGAAASFSVAATGVNLSYQWRKGGAPISGATASSFTIKAATAGDTGSYDVVVTGACGAATSNAAALAVNATTAIATPPANQTVCAGSPATFNVAATGAGLSYQWRKNGASLSGATASSYSIPSVAAGDAGSYDVVVTGACGVETANAATLTVNSATALTTQPANQTVCASQSATFSVTATGTGLSYQWRKGGAPISGATASTYNTPSAAASDAGSYDVVVTGSCGSVTSNAATLTVNAATAINTQPQSAPVCAGVPASFSVAATGVNLSYQWRKGGTNLSGATASTYAIPAATASDAGSYDVVVTGACGSATSNAATLTVNAATAITTQPAHQASCLGGAATFAVTASGTSLSHQWRKNGAPISGATSSSFSIASITAGDAASYDVVVTGACGTVASAAATLTINSSTNINTQPANQTACVGGAASFSVAASGAGTLTYQWRKGGAPINGANAASFTINPVAAADAGSYDVVVTSACGTTTSNAATLTINAATAISAQPQVATGCAGAAASFSVAATGVNLSYQWRKNGVAINGATASSYTTPATVAGDSGALYSVVVTGACGAVTSNAVALAVNAATAITAQPTNQTVITGQSATFSVTAAGVNLSYQWRKHGNAIPGATAGSYTIKAATPGDAGDYDVVVAGSCGSITSNLALLTVNCPAAALAPASQSFGATGGTGTVAVTLPAGCAWTATSNDGWLTITSGTPGNGNGTVLYAVAANAGAQRGGTLTVAGQTFTVTQAAAGLEADVAPRATGNHAVNVADYVQVGRFAIGLEAAAAGGEFQRADCAPRDTLGNGSITVADYVQAGRYAIGLDLTTSAGGPTGPGSASLPEEEAFNWRRQDNPFATPRTLRLAAEFIALPQGLLGLALELDAQGGENGLSCTLRFDAAQLRYHGFVFGGAAALAGVLTQTAKLEQGELGLLLTLPPGVSLEAGTRQMLVLVFAPQHAAARAPLPALSLPELVDADANPLPVQVMGKHE